ncbi:hypothetical protein Tco_0194370 [Tanacetum coccineum]
MCRPTARSNSYAHEWLKGLNHISTRTRKTFMSNDVLDIHAVPSWEPDFMEDNDDDSDNDDDLINDLKNEELEGERLNNIQEEVLKDKFNEDAGSHKKQKWRTLISLVSRDVGEILLLIMLTVLPLGFRTVLNFSSFRYMPLRFLMKEDVVGITYLDVIAQWAVSFDIGLKLKDLINDERILEEAVWKRTLKSDLADLDLIIDKGCGDVEIVNKRANVVWICQILQEISQKRTRERMSDQEAKEIKAEAREIMPQPSTVNCS